MILPWPSRASTTLPALPGSGGIPEVPSGSTTPSRSPPLAATAVTKHSSKNARARRGGAAFTITEECERLFCETLKTIFLGEGGMALQDSLVTGTATDSNVNQDTTSSAPPVQQLHASYESFSSAVTANGMLTDWLEMYDYAGGARFRGFIADGQEGRSMFVFFDAGVLGNDLKPGLMALLELCSIHEVDCSKLVVCVDRTLEAEDSKTLLRDLGWVGFEPITLDEWAEEPDLTSARWIFLSMEA